MHLKTLSVYHHQTYMLVLSAAFISAGFMSLTDFWLHLSCGFCNLIKNVWSILCTKSSLRLSFFKHSGDNNESQFDWYMCNTWILFIHSDEKTLLCQRTRHPWWSQMGRGLQHVSLCQWESCVYEGKKGCSSANAFSKAVSFFTRTLHSCEEHEVTVD